MQCKHQHPKWNFIFFDYFFDFCQKKKCEKKKKLQNHLERNDSSLFNAFFSVERKKNCKLILIQ